jgi:hydrocephalus-inducing protein
MANSSLLPVDFTLAYDKQTLDENCTTLSPVRGTIPARSTLPLRVTFAPTERLRPFRDEITAEVQGQLFPLTVITGSCQGVRVELDTDQLNFGAVVVQNTVTRHLLLTNTGDIGARFRWQLPARFEHSFSIAPLEGYLSPGLEVRVAVTFAPRRQSPVVRFEGVKCTIEGGAPLLVDISGLPTAREAEKEPLVFHCPVRSHDTKTIKLANPSDKPWVIQPVVEGSAWTGPASLTLPAGDGATYTLRYAPLVMTGGDGKHPAATHEGSVFFPFPNGTALLYQLSGTAGPPEAVLLPVMEVPCKTKYTRTLTVRNWLPRPQRFKVVINRVKSDPSTRVEGAFDFIDVPANGSMDYTLSFFAFKEGTTALEVVFKNPKSGEYCAFELSFKAIAAGVLDTIALQAPVRQTVTQTVTLENPLPQSVQFSMTTAYTDGTEGACPEIHGPAHFRVPGRSTAFEYTFEFLPLLVRDTAVRLTFSSSELGTAAYDLRLSARPAGPLPTERFEANLGQQHTRRLSLTHFNPHRDEYTVTVDTPDFIVPPTLATPAATKAGAVATLEVCFEPLRLGDCRATLTVASATGGEFTYPLYGRCTPARPAGPFVIRAGKRAAIPFKNIFASKEQFTCTVDSPLFSVKASEAIKGKETADIHVKYEAKDDVARTGRLTVTCASGNNAGSSWIFYLQGTA